MKKILIPIDFSENSVRAVIYGRELFKYEKTAFYLMHAYADDIYSKNYTKVQLEEAKTKVNEDVKRNLSKIVKDISKNRVENHEYILMPSFNSLIDETERIVKTKDIDLVIMGTKGISNDKKLTFGSNTIQVVRFIESPVLSVPNSGTIKEPKSILFLTDFTKPYIRRELELICEFSHQFRSKIEILFVSKKKNLSQLQEKHKKLIDEVLCKIPLSFTILENTNVINTIVKYINNNGIDLLVLTNTKHTSVDKIILPSVIDGVSGKVDLPILVLQNMRKA